VALALAQDGWRIAVHYRSSQIAAEETVRLIQDSGGDAVSVQADLNDPQQTRTLIAKASDALNAPLTALINNASTFIADTAENAHAYALNMAVNLEAPLQLSSDFAKQTDHGAILHMLDQRVLKPNPLYFSYSLSKAALFWAMKTQAQSFAPGIRVNGIGPGPTLRNTDQIDDEFEAEAAATLLGRGSPPDDMVSAARFLLGVKSVTGQMIAVDAGQHLTWQTPDLMVGQDIGDA
jgi:NAD(P)-dependent dehydrogenase (short-subunit alcohol dehydrogenase family)